MYNNGIMEYDGNNIMVYHHLVGGFKYLFICFQHAKGMMGWRWQISLSDVLKSPTRSWWANGVQDVSKCIGKVQHPVEKKILISIYFTMNFAIYFWWIPPCSDASPQDWGQRIVKRRGAIYWLVGLDPSCKFQPIHHRYVYNKTQELSELTVVSQLS